MKISHYTNEMTQRALRFNSNKYYLLLFILGRLAALVRSRLINGVIPGPFKG